MARSRSTSKQPRRGASTISKPSPKQTSVPVPVTPKPTGVAQPAGVAQPQQPGLIGQMASTAAGVAVGSTIGHTLGSGIGSLFGGGSNPEPSVAPEQPQYNAQTYPQPNNQGFQGSNPAVSGASCEVDAKALTKCLEQNGHKIELCHWYLENLKACQEMARQF
ncbi:529_t:CDS:2 [Ambispora gerdemannii]|uniref:529_t:CDS:1 n=1 Tax=Ambispora gerdemannii TaxID=144530 RepID=A0A9N8UZQ8_9GLOM|nr:529_t:CDS:2 [Ambispora gerdemannii]